MMEKYDSLSQKEKNAVEAALDTLTDETNYLGIRLNKGDHAARAAEALAIYIIKSKEK